MVIDKYMTHNKAANTTFWTAFVMLAIAFGIQFFISDKIWLAWIDNLHWTLGCLAAAILSWIGFTHSSGAEHEARRWFFFGLLSYLIGQIFWDIQFMIGWNPFPAPSDLFYLMLGPGCLLGLMAGMKVLLPKKNLSIALLDAMMIIISVLALTLALYLPASAEIDLLSLSVMTAYPVALLSAGCFGILMILHVCPRLHWSWVTFQFGLALQGLVWMWWNYQALTGSTTEGSALNELFSVASLVVGFSALHWHMSPSENKKYSRVCAEILRMLPIFAVIVAATATIMALASAGLLPEIRNLIFISAVCVVILASWRQSLMLDDSQKLLEAELLISESNRFLHRVIDNVPAGIFWKDLKLNYQGGNVIFQHDAGVSNFAEVINKSDYDMVWKEHAESYQSDDHVVLDSGKSKLNFDEQVTTAKDGVKWVRTSKVPLRDNQNRLVGLLGIYHDITEAKKMEEWQRITSVTFETQEAIMITDSESRILRVNRAFQEISGYMESEVVGNNPRMFSSERHDAQFYSKMWSTLNDTGKWSGEIWDKRKNGDVYPQSMTITAVYNDHKQVTHYVAIFRDITERKKSEQEIYQLAFFDPLTNLPNRRLLVDRLNHAMQSSLRNGRYGALLYMDMDHFKDINDTRGHPVGDLLLIEVSKRLQSCVREGDSIARIGGDEFVVVLEELSSGLDDAVAQTEMVAEKIRSELSNPYILNGDECQSTPSIGVCLFFGSDENVDDLLKHADVAMYQAKMAGRNIIRFFDPEMQTILNKRETLQAELRAALEAKQLVLYYQIQVDISGHPLGAEALLRWEHPTRGLVSPADFIPLAENTGLIIPIGLWVLKSACETLKTWQLDTFTRNLVLAVNVSARQFKQNDFVSQVQKALLESGADPSRLKLELTESAVLENIEDTADKMNKIKLLGVGISLDDFGTGYSSLQYLKRLPLDQIKIDRSFVRDITTDSNDAAIVQTIIAMTRSLGLDVIAEGVETEPQRNYLESEGCRTFQGYLFGYPIPLDQFELLLREKQLS